MHSVAEQSLLKLALALLLRELPQLIECLESIRLPIGVDHRLDENIKITTAPVKVTIIHFFKQVRYLLDQLHEVLRPLRLDQGSDHVPGLNRGIIDYVLILLLVLRLRSNVEGSLYVGKG